MQAIEDNINTKYANKVIQKIGLCICLYDLTWASEGLIGHGTGTANVNGACAFPPHRPPHSLIRIFMARETMKHRPGALIHSQPSFVSSCSALSKARSSWVV